MAAKSLKSTSAVYIYHYLPVCNDNQYRLPEKPDISSLNYISIKTGCQQQSNHTAKLFLYKNSNWCILGHFSQLLVHRDN
jgi:hypothetical protein